MKNITGILYLAFLLVTALFRSTAVAQDYYWYEGGEKKTLHYEEGVVAEYGINETDGSSVSAVEPNAERMKVRGGAALWRVPSSKSIMNKSSVLKNGAGLSPVFREGGDPNGRMMTLPGNVIVYFKSTWSEQDVRLWAARNNLTIVNKMNIGKNAYVIKSGAGLDSLNLANSLQEAGEVESATPNWSRAITLR